MEVPKPPLLEAAVPGAAVPVVAVQAADGGNGEDGQRVVHAAAHAVAA